MGCWTLKFYVHVPVPGIGGLKGGQVIRRSRRGKRDNTKGRSIGINSSLRYEGTELGHVERVRVEAQVSTLNPHTHSGFPRSQRSFPVLVALRCTRVRGFYYLSRDTALGFAFAPRSCITVGAPGRDRVAFLCVCTRF